MGNKTVIALYSYEKEQCECSIVNCHIMCQEKEDEMTIYWQSMNIYKWSRHANLARNWSDYKWLASWWVMEWYLNGTYEPIMHFNFFSLYNQKWSNKSLL